MRYVFFLCLLGLAGPLLISAQAGMTFSPAGELEHVQQRLAGFEADGPADSVVFYYEKQADLYCQLDRLDDWLYSYWDLQAYFYEDAERALTILETALMRQWRPPAAPAEWEALLWVHTNRGYQSFQMGRVLAAARAYERAAGIYEAQEFPDFDIVGYVYLPLGAHYTRLGDNDRARSVYRRALDRDDLPPDVLGGLYNNLALTHWDEGDFANAERYFSAGLAATGLPPLKRALLLTGRGRTAYDRGRPEVALASARQAIALLAPLLKEETVLDYRSGAQALLGLLAAGRGEFGESEAWYAQALENGIAAYGTSHHRTIGKIYVGLARMRLQSGDGTGALQAANRALQSVLPSFRPERPEDLPSPDLFYEENTIIEALEAKADALHLLAAPAGDTAGLRRALACYERGLAVEEMLGGTYHYESARLVLQAKSRARTEKALALAWELRKAPGIPGRALAIAERSKSQVLLAAIRDNLARREITQGDTLLSRERDLRRLRAFYQKELILGDGDDQSSVLRRRLAETTDALARLNAELQRRYPRLSRLDKRPDTAPGSVAAQLLPDPDALLLEYFAGKEHLFAFRVDGAGEVTMVRLDSTARLREPLTAFLQLLRSRNDLSTRRTDFLDLAQRLYGRLLAPLVETTEPLPSEVVLVPDGPLAFLPFEALLTGRPPEENWAAMPFLLKKYPLRYAYSVATLHEQSQLRAPAEYNVLDVAPGFANSERGLTPLYATGLGAGIPGTEVLRAEAATVDNLEARAGRFRVLHLSTHARVDSLHLRPRIELIDAPLYLPQLYALDLRAELVTLSACETGLGNLAEGEGVMSLARGFAYAGAASLVSSLWTVNEQSTARIFHRFYGHLAAGLPKGRALHQAKLDYLRGEAPSFQKSPYYWAGILFVGDGAPLVFRPGGGKWRKAGIIGLLMGAVLVGYWWWRRN